VHVYWNLVKCTCGHHFGIKKGNRMSCSRCSKTIDLKILNSFSSSKELSIAVSSANAPDEVKNIIKSKLKKASLKSNNKIEEINNFRKFQNVIKKSIDVNGVLKLENLVKVLHHNGITNITAEELIETSEFEGLIIRSGHKEWTWL
jgi:hypothetical protein